MASRLYPGFGSGKGAFDERLDVRSFASAGRPDLEAGDKLFLPAAAFREISRLRLPFPLTFRVQNERLRSATAVPGKDGRRAPEAPEQFAGVLEFSAPDGCALAPSWMLQNLRLREGGRAQFTTVRDLPRGAYARLQPHSAAFVELAAAVGPRDLLEVALRNYSALSAGERIMLDVADEKYFLDVLEVRPGRAISIYGNVDLEIDFAPVKGSADDIAISQQKAQESGSAKDKAAATAAIAAAEAAEANSALAAAARAKAALLESKPGSDFDSPSRARAQASPSISPAKPALISQLVAKSSLRSPERAKSTSKPATEPASPNIFSLPMVAFGDLSDGAVASEPSTLPAFLQPPADLPTTAKPAQSVAKPDAKALARMREERARAAAARLSQQQAETPALRTYEAEGWPSSAASNRSPPIATQASSIRAPAEAAPPPQRADASPWASKEGDAREGKAEATPKIVAPSLIELEEDGVSPARRCPLCTQDVPRASFEMHSLRCARSAAYHKTSCAECGQQLFAKDAPRHVHCALGCGALLDLVDSSKSGSAAAPIASMLQAAAVLHAQVCQLRPVSCECGASWIAASLEAHRLECPSAKSACRFCRVTHKKMALAAHEERCGSRTQACEECGALIVLRGMAEHNSSGSCPGPSKLAAAVSPPLPPAQSEQAHGEGKEDGRAESKEGDGRKPSTKAFSRLSAAVAAGASGAGKAGKLPERAVEKQSLADESLSSNSGRSSVVPWGGAAPASPSKRGAAAITAAAESSAAAKILTGAVAAERAKVVVKGAAPARPSVAAPRRELLQCPHCNKGQSDYEALQMHVFTACTKAPADGGAGRSGARATVPRAKGAAAPSKR